MLPTVGSAGCGAVVVSYDTTDSLLYTIPSILISPSSPSPFTLCFVLEHFPGASSGGESSDLRGETKMGRKYYYQR